MSTSLQTRLRSAASGAGRAVARATAPASVARASATLPRRCCAMAVSAALGEGVDALKLELQRRVEAVVSAQQKCDRPEESEGVDTHLDK